MSGAGRLIALTGASGFIGRATAARLRAEGWRVRALARDPARLPSDIDEVVPGALDDPDALARLVAGAARVVHLAGAVKARRRADFDAVNEGGTARLAAAAAAAGVGRTIIVSSLAAREPTLSPYAASKRAGEEAALAALAALGPGRAVIARPAVVYGPGDREFAPMLALMARGWLIAPPDPAARLALVYVDDVAAALAALAAAPDDAALGPTPFEIHDGAAEGGRRYDGIAADAGVAFDRRVRVIRAPATLLAFVGAVNSWLARLRLADPMFTAGKAAEALHRDWRADSAPLARATGWRAQIPFDQGARHWRNGVINTREAS